MYYIQDYEYYVILINIIALLCLTENGRQMRNLGFFLKVKSKRYLKWYQFGDMIKAIIKTSIFCDISCLFSFKKVFMHMFITRQGYLCQGPAITDLLCYISPSSVWLKPAFLHLWTNIHICWELRGRWYHFWLVSLNSLWVFLASPRLVCF